MSSIANCLVKIESSNLSRAKKIRLCERISGILDETKTINQIITIFQSLMNIWFNSPAILEEIYKTLHNENFCFLHNIYIQIDSENKTSRISLFRHTNKMSQNQVNFDINIYKTNQIDACKSEIMAIPFIFQINNNQSSHANMLIINTKAKTVDHFEPHGTYSGSSNIPQELINTQIDKLIDMLVDRSIYTVTHPDATCPNLQGFVGRSEWSGTCAMFTMFYAIKRLLNPEKSHREITTEIETIFRTSSNPVNTIIYITKSLMSLLNIDETDMTVNSRQINPQYKLTYSSGRKVYHGKLVNGLPQEYGVITLPDKTQLIGFFNNGELHEKARMILPDKTEISGIYTNGSMNGNGEIKYTNGDIYTGNITDNKQNGIGTMVYKNGNIYEGNWIDNIRTGQGTMNYYANDDMYQGNWLNFARSGQGVMRYENGDMYEGNWLYNKQSGYGLMTYANGDFYRGNWLYNKQNGIGTMVYKNGNRYEGNWIDNEQDNKNFPPSTLSGIGTYTPSSPEYAPSSPEFVANNSKLPGGTKKRRNKMATKSRRKGKCYKIKNKLCLR